MFALHIDYDENILIVACQNHRIRKIDLRTGILNTVYGNGSRIDSGDGGVAIRAGIPYPFSIVKHLNNSYILAVLYFVYMRFL